LGHFWAHFFTFFFTFFHIFLFFSLVSLHVLASCLVGFLYFLYIAL
jgi:hypothetical protein